MSNRDSERIRIVQFSRRVEVKVGGRSIAESRELLLLHEVGHDPVYYFPPSDVDFEYLTPTDLKTHCPYKGDANYWTIEANGIVLENSVWCYNEPLASVGEIAGMMAFYQNRVDKVGALQVAD